MYGGDIYLDGDFTQHQFTDANRMRYNPASGLYELSMMLKMGSYNYQYLWLPDGSTTALTGPIEGNHYHTVNEYLSLVYYRPVGQRYDRLGGAAAQRAQGHGGHPQRHEPHLESGH